MSGVDAKREARNLLVEFRAAVSRLPARSVVDFGPTLGLLGQLSAALNGLVLANPDEDAFVVLDEQGMPQHHERKQRPDGTLMRDEDGRVVHYLFQKGN